MNNLVQAPQCVLKILFFHHSNLTDLLISRDCFETMPFLSRFRIDSDTDLSQLSESSRRHHLNELRIRGSNKAIVRIVLSGTMKQEREKDLAVRWVIRKRVFVGSSKQLEEYGRKYGVADDASPLPLAKRPKIADSSEFFIGDGHDSEIQQRTNWRWFASKFNPTSFARAFRIPFDFFGCAISQAVGEVVKIEPEPPDSASLAIVTVKRLILPEHTVNGRLSQHNENDVFEDSDVQEMQTDQTLNLPDENLESRNDLFQVPIEDILVISKRIILLPAFDKEKRAKGLTLTGAYSLRQNRFFHFDRAETTRTTSTEKETSAISTNVEKYPGKSKKKEPPSWNFHTFESSPKLVDCMLVATLSDHSNNSATKHETMESSFWYTQALLKGISTLDFSIGPEFVPFSIPVSPRPMSKTNSNIRKRQHQGKSKKPIFKSSISSRNQITGHRESHENRDVLSVQSSRIQQTAKVLSSSCSRMFSFDTENRRFDNPDMRWSSGTSQPTIPTMNSMEKLRNSRSEAVPLPIVTQPNRDIATRSHRALRANQRRLLRDVISIGLDVDALLTRDYEENLRFDRSRIHAWGVFADRAIKENQMIVEYRGEIIGNAVAEKREIIYSKSNIGSDYMFRIDSHTVCDATKQGNVARFINHSCNPNCFTKIISTEGVQRIVVYAKRNIDPGEELCYDYKFPIEPDLKKRIPCHCGANVCRGYMN